MGEKERGIPDERQRTAPSTTSTSVIATPNSQETLPSGAKETAGGPDKQVVRNAPNVHANGPFGTFALAWRNLIWEKWRWGAVIALAVLVSRLSSN